ncbi:aquaporin Z [Actinomyces succiniciruminis]|uniref:Aquaporin Z n=1 Tax=Actinomyces succiniciruminis TaxID=1522002 RepID=A0A1L7R9F7_9ACTO|nr:aquaporin Z [Actinomyces succiniciruminis]CED90475.1 Aquaporin Z [Actinomyces succiniciruminis]
MAPLSKRLGAEFLGTFWLVFAGCGSAVLAATAITDSNFPVGIGYLGVALAFGLAVTTMAYAVGAVSGGHFNPAVTLGLAVAGRFAWKDVLPYWCIQIVAGLVGGGVLYAIASGSDSFDVAANGFAANGYGAHSPHGYSMAAGFICELVMTAIFLIVILGSTDSRAPKGFAPLAIGSTLTLILLVSIPVTNASVNPARSIAVAFEAGNGAPGQLWLFIVAPLLGAAIAGFSYAFLLGKDPEQNA